MYFLLGLCIFNFSFISSAELSNIKDPLWMQAFRGHIVNIAKQEIKKEDIENDCECFIKCMNFQSSIPSSIKTPEGEKITQLAFGDTLRIALLDKKNILYFWDKKKPFNRGYYQFEDGEVVQSIAVAHNGEIIGACVRTCRPEFYRMIDKEYFYAFMVVDTTLKKLYDIELNEKGTFSKGQIKMWFNANDKVIVTYSLKNAIAFNPIPLVDIESLSEQQKELLQTLYNQYLSALEDRQPLITKTFRERSEDYTLYQSLPPVIKNWLKGFVYISSI